MEFLNKIVLKRSNGVWILIVALPAVCAGLLWREYASGRLRQELYLQSFIPLLLIALAMAVIFVLREIYLRVVVRSSVEVNSLGVVDNTSRNPLGLIAWRDVESLDIVRGPLAAMITVAYKSRLQKEFLKVGGLRISAEVERNIKYLQLEAGSHYSQSPWKSRDQTR